MKTAGVVFDFYDDPTGSVLKKAFPAPDELPEQIKVAHILSPEEHDVLRDDAYALRMNNEGKILRKFACVDAGNTLLSMLYLEEAAGILPDEAIKTAATNIAEFAESFGLGLTPFIKESMEKEAIFGLSAKERNEKDMVQRHNSWTDEMNHPDNIKKLNDVHSHILKTKHKTTQAKATEEQHNAALDEAYKHPHFSAIHDKHWKTKTSATGMGRNRDSMRQPMVGDEADWAQRTNLVSVRGGADSGRVIPTANQMKTAAADCKKQDFLRLGAKKGFSEDGKEKKSGVEGGGVTLTDDCRDNGPAKKNPAAPSPGPLKDPNSFAIGPGKGDLEVNFKSVVDVSNIPTKTKFKKTSSVKMASGRYPLDSYGDVQAAVRYFDEHWTEMTPAQRHEYAVPVAERIEELKIKTSSELLGRYGSTEYAPDLEAHIASRKASAPKEFGDAYNLLKEKRSSVSPEQFVGLLTDIDKACGLNWHYGDSICDPYLATYGGLEKSASVEPWTWSNADGVSVNQVQLQELAQSEAISHNFGQDVGSAFKSDPVGIFESMPDNSKTIMATLAKGLEKTSGWGAKGAEALKKKGLLEIATKAAKIRMGK